MEKSLRITSHVTSHLALHHTKLDDRSVQPYAHLLGVGSYEDGQDSQKGGISGHLMVRPTVLKAVWLHRGCQQGSVQVGVREQRPKLR